MPPFRLSDVRRVEFYKLDELTTDIICCEIALSDEAIFAHEEMPNWSEIVRKLQVLDGFDIDWFSKVSQPAFASTNYIAFERGR